MPSPAQTNRLPLIAGYLASVLLVICFVNLFPVWKLVYESFDSRVIALLPLSVTLIILLTLLVLFRKKIFTGAGDNRVIIIGMCVCLIGLLVPPGHLPAKRIHVAEYMLLSCVVRFTLSLRMQGNLLLTFSIVFTALLGMHDEFLQGLHNARTYGLRDMITNMLGGAGGSLIWHGLGLFAKENTAPLAKQASAPLVPLLLLATILISTIALIWPFYFYRGAALPFWPAVPVLGATACFLLYRQQLAAPWNHGITAICGAAASLVVYPLLARIGEVVFY